MKTICCIGTGPSLTLSQIETAREKGFTLFGCNKIFQIVPYLSVLYAVNSAFWDHYWDKGLSDHAAEKWTTNKAAAKRYGLNLIGERHKYGLSTNKAYVHHGHGSGYTQVNLAYLMGAERIVLLGYDMKYAPDYDGKQQKIGSSPRHYFGEYPASMQHWPSVSVRQGIHIELLDLYRSVWEQGLVEIVNSTPDSALEPIFGYTDIKDVIQ